MSGTTVMQVKENTSFTQKQQQEYNEAVVNGFTGTIEEYFQVRDYA